MEYEDEPYMKRHCICPLEVWSSGREIHKGDFSHNESENRVTSGELKEETGKSRDYDGEFCVSTGLDHSPKTARTPLDVTEKVIFRQD